MLVLFLYCFTNCYESWFTLHVYFILTNYVVIHTTTSMIGYEPAGLTVHPPPRMIEGGFIFFVWVSSATKIFSSKKKWIL